MALRKSLSIQTKRQSTRPYLVVETARALIQWPAKPLDSGHHNAAVRIARPFGDGDPGNRLRHSAFFLTAHQRAFDAALVNDTSEVPSNKTYQCRRS